MIDREALAAAILGYTAKGEPERSPDLSALIAAARELLAGQKVWWCHEHEQHGNKTTCWWYGFLDPDLQQPCRMVEAVLVIPDEKET